MNTFTTETRREDGMHTHFNKHITWEWAKVGMMQGLGRAIRLGYSYMALPLVAAIVGFLWQAGMDVNTVLSGGESRLLADPMAIIGAIFALFFFGVFYVGFGTVLGVVPAAILGMVSGAIIGAVLALPHIAPHRWNRLAAGVGIGLVIATLLNQVVLSMTVAQSEDALGAYLFFIGVPSLIYVGFCAWLSDQFPTLVAKHQHPREFPVLVRL
jgi:hypothetical protein